MRLLTAKVKLQAVLEVVNDGKSLKDTCLKYGVTRQSLRVWIKKYQLEPAKGALSLKNNFRAGQAHPRHASWKIERDILDLVVKHPSYSIYSIKRELVLRGFLISASGVYQVLLRRGLQTNELRQRFSIEHPHRTVLAHAMSVSVRSKIIEEYTSGRKNIVQISRTFGISRPTFYLWLKRFSEGESRMESLERRYQRGVYHHRTTVSPATREKILSVVLANPRLSCHKLHAKLAASGVGAVTHQALQNLLFREGLNQYSSRLSFARRYGRQIQPVAPLYVPQMPLYRLRMLLAPFVTVPKLLITSPRKGLILLVTSLIPLSLFAIFVRAVLDASSHASFVGLIFASVALFFGLFFFIYSLSYYASILVVLRLAQAGGQKAGEAENAQ